MARQGPLGGMHRSNPLFKKMYSENHPLEREQYLRRALGDKLYEWLEEVEKMEQKLSAIICPKCGAVNFREAKIGDVIRCNACEETFILDICRYFCLDCEMYFFTNNKNTPACPVCFKLGKYDINKLPAISHLTPPSVPPEGKFKGRLEAQLKECDPSRLDQHRAGAKLDANKSMAGLLGDFGLALLSVADVCTYGAAKYSRRGWEKVENAQERYKNAAYRHILKLRYSDVDEDSGLPHLAHLAWNILAILELKIRSEK